MSKFQSIAIDGPASAGKSTVAKILAKDLNYIYCDTGAMYRGLTWLVLQEKIDLNDEAAVLKILKKSDFLFETHSDGQRVFINQKDVTEAIRSSEVTSHVSQISAYPTIREELVKRQQTIAATGNIVMDGRDIGTAVLPNASVKIFLVASVAERAERRFKENQAKGLTNESLDTIKKAIEARDYQDTHRSTSPLRQASDAILVDATGLNIEEVVKEIKKVVQSAKKSD